MVLVLHRILIERNSFWKNVFYSIIFATSCFSLIATYSRGAMVTLVVGTMVILIRSKKILSKKTLIFGVLLMSVGGYVFFNTNIFRELRHRFEQDIVLTDGIPRIIHSSSLGFRITTAISAIRTFSKKPLLGWGDSESVTEQWRRDVKTDWKWIRSSGNHVYYLKHLAKRGMVAFSGIIMCFVAVV